jgi:hypothetical protein
MLAHLSVTGAVSVVVTEGEASDGAADIVLELSVGGGGGCSVDVVPDFGARFNFL